MKFTDIKEELGIKDTRQLERHLNILGRGKLIVNDVGDRPANNYYFVSDFAEKLIPAINRIVEEGVKTRFSQFG